MGIILGYAEFGIGLGIGAGCAIIAFVAVIVFSQWLSTKLGF